MPENAGTAPLPKTASWARWVPVPPEHTAGLHGPRKAETQVPPALDSHVTFQELNTRQASFPPCHRTRRTEGHSPLHRGPAKAPLILLLCVPSHAQARASWPRPWSDRQTTPSIPGGHSPVWHHLTSRWAGGGSPAVRPGGKGLVDTQKRVPQHLVTLLIRLANGKI